ncbi:hypothetical protein D3C87_1704620 [compost metagenome]
MAYLIIPVPPVAVIVICPFPSPKQVTLTTECVSLIGVKGSLISKAETVVVLQSPLSTFTL